jgi:competence protein ComEC
MRTKTVGKNAIWKLSPFFRLTVPLIAGIIVEKKFPVLVGLFVSVFCLCVILIIVCNIVSLSAFIGLEWVPGIVFHIAIFSFSCILMGVHQDTQIEQSSCYIQNHPNLLLLRLLNDPVQKQDSYKCLASVQWLSKDHTCFTENERIFVHFYKKPDADQYSAGSLIIFRKTLRPIENLKSLIDFDYKNYCHLRHIYAQVFLKENEFALVLPERQKSLFTPLDFLRKKLLIIIKKYVPGKSENSLLEALMVGFTDDLDPGVLKSYADTGVIHIIAISGLHLALICHILQLALQKTGRKKYSRWIRFAMIITSLWGYSLLSGASPSVIRAAGMFTLVLFARDIGRETVLYNTLAASAFLLLCFDPFWLWDTGFQLSYAAVLSLRLFSKPLKDLVVFQNKILASVWNATSVSISAQILTTPISIFYFHRFPSYFLIANLLAVPLSSGILIGGILLCIFSFLHPLGYFLGWLLNFMIYSLNGFIVYISQLPGAVISPLVISLPQVIVIYIIIFCIYCFLKKKQKTWLIIGLAFVSLFQLTRLIH